VADSTCWSLTNPRERFWASRTRQLHRAHLATFDRLWSCLPYLRPMLTMTADSIRYGRDEDGPAATTARHPVRSVRAQAAQRRGVRPLLPQQLVRAVAPYRLTSSTCNDVLNVFQVTGLTPTGATSSSEPGARG